MLNYVNLIVLTFHYDSTLAQIRQVGDDKVSAEIYFSSTSPIVNFFDGKTSYSHNSLPIGSPSVKTVASASESNPKSPRKSSDKSGGLFWA